MSNEFCKLLADAGIVHHKTVPDTPMQNGKAEHFNRTIIEAAKSMLHTVSLPFSLWEEAVHTAIRICNCASKKAFGWCTSVEALIDTILDVFYFRIFDCLAYYHIYRDKCHKLELNSQKLVFVDYKSSSKGYRL